MDFKRLDKYYEELKQGLLEAEKAVRARNDKEKQEENDEGTGRLMFNEITKITTLECKHKSLSQEIMFLISEIIGTSIEDTAKDFMKQNEPKSTVQ